MSYHHFEVVLGRAQWNEPLDMPRGGRRPIRDSPRAADAHGGDAAGGGFVAQEAGVTVPVMEIASARGNTTGV